MGRRAVRLLAAIAGSALALLLAVSPSVYAAPGDLDPTFSGDGRVLTDVGAGGDDAASAMAIQPDGKIVVAGFTSQPAGGRTFAIVRYEPDGALDLSFGNDGIVTTSFGGSNAAARGVAIEPDGDIVVAGASSQPDTGWDFALARFEPDGSLDPAFGQNGRVTTDFDGSDGANALALQPDGGIVVVGQSGRDFAVARYDPDGTPDTGFSGDGIATTDFAGRGDVAYAVALQGDGRIVAAGYATQYEDFFGDVSLAALARYQADGTPDPSFSGDGMVVTDGDSNAYRIGNAYAIGLQADGRIVFGGSAESLLFLRYNPDGSRDLTFGDQGGVLAPGAQARALAIQADGGFLAAGEMAEDFLVARWDSNGTPDPGFGLPRRRWLTQPPPGALTDFGVFDADKARALAIQPDGKIVAVGRSSPNYYQPGDFALARYRVDSLAPADADADGVDNQADRCDHRHSTHPDGCPHYPQTVTIRYSNRQKAFRGRVFSDLGSCHLYSRAAIFRNRPGEDVMVGDPSAAYGGTYRVPYPRRRGWYYAKVDRRMTWDFGVCLGDRSELVRVRRK